jgi:hypothetical protein
MSTAAIRAFLADTGKIDSLPTGPAADIKNHWIFRQSGNEGEYLFCACRASWPLTGKTFMHSEKKGSVHTPDFPGWTNISFIVRTMLPVHTVKRFLTLNKPVPRQQSKRQFYLSQKARVQNPPYVFYWKCAFNFINFDFGLIWTISETVSQMGNSIISCPYPTHRFYYLTTWHNNREY